MKRKRIGFLIITAILLITLNGCAREEKLSRYDATFLQLFDTVTTIAGYSRNKDDFSKFSQIAHDKLEEYHKLYDIYNSYDGINNIKTINDNAGVAPVVVDQRILDLIEYSIYAEELTKGELNIAFGSVLKIWHEYRTEGIDDPENAKLPPMELLMEKAEHTDIGQIIIDKEARTVYLTDPEMSLDVGAIAKGYATERVAQELIELGYGQAMISVGGNVRTIGTKPEGEPWKVGIQNPDLESEQINLYILKLQDLSLVTSGDYQRYYTVDGKTYHHIIDKDTLMSTDYFTAVSIITKDSGLADALSTSVFNMDLEQGMALIESMPGTEALWVLKNGEHRYSSGFLDLLIENE